MTWPAKTHIPGSVFTAADGNAFLRDPLTDLRAGGLALIGQAAQHFLFASSSTQWGGVAPTSGSIPKFNGTTWEMVQPLDLVWPVGSIYRSVVATNPATLLGIGTWSAFGLGRVVVAFDATQAEFDTTEETGGSKTVTLDSSHLPSHTHTQNSHNHTQNPHSHTIPNIGNTLTAKNDPPDVTIIDNAGTETTNTTTATNNAATAVNQSTGGGGAHQNLMPYVVCFAWKRTA
jgi:microcystin-dependent protein